MALGADTILQVLKTVGEATRLRIVSVLRHGELSVTDLTDVLAQSQPRISRHLKLLADAGVLTRHREGARVFFQLDTRHAVAPVVSAILDELDPTDPIFVADYDRLSAVRERRHSAASEHFAEIASRWDQLRSLHAPEHDVDRAIITALGPRTDRTLIDLGTGTGRMIELLGTPDHQRLVGLDASHSMLSVARANFADSVLDGRVELRQADVYRTPFDSASFDLVVIHQVLHYLDDPATAIAEASRLVSPDGKVVIVDFAAHELEFLRSDHAHHRLGIRHDVLADWAHAAGLSLTERSTLQPATPNADSHLTVEIWVAEPSAHTANQLARTPS